MDWYGILDAISIIYANLNNNSTLEQIEKHKMVKPGILNCIPGLDNLNYSVFRA